MRRIGSVVVAILLGLAVIGLISRLFTDTVNFLLSIFLMVAIGVVIFAAIYYFVLRNSQQPNDMRKYRQAVKQSKQKYQKRHTPYIQKASQQKKPRVKRVRRQVTHLRVIEGNKDKRKNRAN